ncbi:MAG: hypothetical protein C5B59_00395 [Bacteroidetes bacterium]|nr:MAG: hypothetical protein C5B59_00395 [Bacteroidota bacterium]
MNRALKTNCQEVIFLHYKQFKMKKILFYLVLTTVFVSSLNAQKIRLNAYGSYVFDDHVESYYSTTSYFNGTIKGGLLWGAGLEFRLHETYGMELMYLRQDTHAPVNYFDYNANRAKNANLDLAINWIMLGGSRSMKVNDKVEPYGGLSLGVAILDSKNPDNNNATLSATKFAWGLRLGVNIWASERVGIKLQTQLMSAVQGAGGGIYFGTGGAGAGVSTYSTMLQFGLGGGLTFAFGH